MKRIMRNYVKLLVKKGLCKKSYYYFVLFSLPILPQCPEVSSSSPTICSTHLGWAGGKGWFRRVSEPGEASV